MNATGTSSGNGPSSEPVVSADGRYITSSSYASNLIASDANKASDIFVRDLQSGATTLVSSDITGALSGNGNSVTPQISADGRRVMFFSVAKNLLNPAVSGSSNVFWRDLDAGVTYAVTTTGTAMAAAMTPDGRYVLVGASTQLLLWDSTAHTSSNLLTYASPLTEVAISADGKHAGYGSVAASSAMDLNTGASTTLSFVFPTSRARFQFSADGRFLTFLARDAANVDRSVSLRFPDRRLHPRQSILSDGGRRQWLLRFVCHQS